jgi:hypothetical protein
MNQTNSMNFKGSKKHILDLLDRVDFVQEMNKILSPYNASIIDNKTVQPKGYSDIKEYGLQTFINRNNLNSIFPSLLYFNFNKWWNPDGGKAPTWDMISLCKLNNKDAILLVEAKAHINELGTIGKRLPNMKSTGSKNNHKNIEEKISDISRALKELNPEFNISIDKHYQLSNRVAYWGKLKQLNIPVILLYLGFTGDTDFKYHFSDSNCWSKEIHKYLKDAIPNECINNPSSDFVFIQTSLPILL